jgi:HEAT repeat protein
MTIDESTALTQGWALLAEGHTAKAAARAADVLAVHPRSLPALVLLVEAEITQSGPGTALEQYERWLGSRSLEEPSVVRRIALAILQETMAEDNTDAARLEALRALAADGDAAALAELANAVSSGSAPEARALASLGNEQAVKALIGQLQRGGRNAVTTMSALGDSGSKLAIAPLSARLQDSEPEVRGAAVEALGKLGARYDLTQRIKPLLEDPSSFVRTKAAAALVRLGDTSGIPLLRGLLQEESATSRLIGAQGLASQPDAFWLDQVRRLTSASEPQVRIGAARLLAPHDPDLARQVLERGMNDANPAIRDMAFDTMREVVAGDLRTLRIYLKLPDRLGRVRAAAGVLALVR